MKIQIDIPENLSRQLKIEKIRRKHSNLQETVLYILDDYLIKTFKGKEKFLFG